MVVFRSQNGWSAKRRLPLDNRPVPGTSVRLVPGVRAGDVAVVLREVARRFHVEVEPLRSPGCWGHAYRVIRSGIRMSNHASGTAIDLNAPLHPLGRSGTFSGAQVAAIHRILADLQGVVRWGGDYSGRKDEMHFEIVGSSAMVARVARRIQAGNHPSTWATLRRGDRGASVRYLQRLLVDDWGSKIEVTGVMDGPTIAAVRDRQRKMGLVDDGVVGPLSWAKFTSKR